MTTWNKNKLLDLWVAKETTQNFQQLNRHANP